MDHSEMNCDDVQDHGDGFIDDLNNCHSYLDIPLHYTIDDFTYDSRYVINDVIADLMNSKLDCRYYIMLSWGYF